MALAWTRTAQHGTALSTVGRTLGAGWDGLRTIFRNSASYSVSALSLVPSYLSNLLWIIQNEWLGLAQKGYGLSPVVYAVLQTLCRGVAEPPLVAYTTTRDGTLEPLPPAHPLMQLIAQPNEVLTQYLGWFLVVLHQGIGGRSLWWKERDTAGRIAGIWPLRPDRCGPVYSTSDDPGQKLISGWSYWLPNNQYIFLPRQDVLVYNWPNPAGESGGMVEGLGPLQVLSREVSADNEATTFVGSLVANYASPGVLLKTKVAIRNKEEAQLVKAAFKDEWGDSKRGSVGVIDGETEIEQLGFNLRQLEFPDLRAVAESRIAAAFGVPAIIVGLKVGIDASIRATITEQREYFSETTLESHWRMLEDAYTRHVASEFGDGIVCRFDRKKVRALAAQIREEIEPVKDAFKAGAVSLDEYRAKVLNLPPLANGQGEVFYIPTTVQLAADPVDELGAGAAADRAAEERAHKEELAALRPPPMLMPPADGQETPAGDQEKLPRAQVREVPAGQRSARAVKARAQHGTVAAAERAQRAALKARQGYEDDYTPQYHALLSKLARSVASGLGGRKAAPTVDEDALAAFEVDVLELLTEQWREILGDVGQASAESVSAGAVFSLANPHVSKVIDSLAERVKGILDTTRDGIRAAIDEGLAAGETIPQLADRIRELPKAPGVFSEARARVIARTESGEAYNAASALGWRSTGLVSHVRIADGVDFDEPCRVVNGTIQTLEWFAANRLQHPNCGRAASPIVSER